MCDNFSYFSLESSKHFVSLTKKIKRQTTELKEKAVMYNSVATELGEESIDPSDVADGKMNWLSRQSAEGNNVISI